MTQLDIRGTIVGSAALAIKAPCLCATTANITLSGSQTIDGVSVGNNSERVLVKNQSDQTQNGIYIASTSTWVYAADWSNNNNVANGTLVLAASGSVNAGLTFVQTCSDSPIVIGTSLIAFATQQSVTGARYVTGPSSATSGHVAIFSGTSGTVVADGGALTATGALAPLNAVSAQYMLASAIGFGVNMLNGAIAASVAGSALTLAIKTLAGADPSASDPVWFVFRSATASSSTPTVIEVTAALSVTIPSGATLGSSNATPFKAWVVATNNGGTVALAVINCFTAASNNVFPLGGWGIAGSVVNPIANTVATFYGPGSLSNVPYSVLGYFSYETGSTLATAGTYSATPTRLELFRPGVWLPGGTVQSNFAPFSTTATNASTATYSPSVTAPTSTSAAVGPTQSITPSSSAHLLRVRAMALLGSGGVNTNALTAFLTQDAALTAIAASTQPSTLATTTGLVSVPLIYQALANTLASTTFKLFGYTSSSACNINTAGGTTAYFGGNNCTHLLVDEIAT